MLNRAPRLLSALALTVAGAACNGDGAPTGTGNPPDLYTFAKQDSFPHNDSLFTQGLFYEGGFLYEGTGENGNSTLRKIDLATGNTLLRSNILLFSLFGEGIALANGQIVQLTWTSKRAYRYQLADFALVDSLSYPTQGWGLTYDGANFIMSTGTDTLHFRSPLDFSEVGRIAVKDGSLPVSMLNELEYIDGEIYANVLPTDKIAVITPSTGRVRAWIDCTGIATSADRGASIDNILNGIAYDAAGDRLFVTGKRWKKLYQIALVPK